MSYSKKGGTLCLRARLRSFELRRSKGGGGGIRTRDNLSVILTFQASPIVHSGTPPIYQNICLLYLAVSENAPCDDI